MGNIIRADWEIDAPVWLAEHDQGIIELGGVGFDVLELAWTTMRSPNDKRSCWP